MTLYALAAVLLIVGLGLWIETMFGSKEQFVDHRNEITVLSSVFTHRASGTNVYVTVVGILTNHGSFTWKDVGVEAQFFDRRDHSQRGFFPWCGLAASERGGFQGRGASCPTGNRLRVT
jgi:hypothetical protein